MCAFQRTTLSRGCGGDVSRGRGDTRYHCLLMQDARGRALLLVTVLLVGCGATGATGDGHGGSGSGGVGAGAGAGESGGDGTDAQAATCPHGTVSFQLDAAPGQPLYAQEAYPLCANLNWLKIFDTTGVEQTFIFPGNSVDCSSCRPTAWSQICTTTSKSPVDSATAQWTGRRYVSGACGSAGTTCALGACAPAGDYIARMCGSSGTAPDAPRTCIEVQFTYPTSDPVAGQLPPGS